MIASDALQVAVYTALNGQVGAGVGVFDEVPTTAPTPFVVIGEGTERPWDTMTEGGSQETVTLHVWDDATGTRRLKQIMAAVNARLHDARLPMAGATMVMMRREFVEVFREPEDAGKTWRHGVMRYRALITQ